MHSPTTRTKPAPPAATITLPSLTARVRCSQRSKSICSSCRTRSPMHNPPRILIVDDNETNRDILRTRLSPHGYELTEAADGEEAIAATREHHPDLILLDVMMPKIDGIEVCKRIKADADLP